MRPVSRTLALLLTVGVAVVGCVGVRPNSVTYALFVGDEATPTTNGTAVWTDGGWEFRFGEPLRLESLTLERVGKLPALDVYVREGSRWKRAARAESESRVIPLDAMTDGVRVVASSRSRGTIAACVFRIAPAQPLFSRPLEKPPFIR
jgi:hypothetical protein